MTSGEPASRCTILIGGAGERIGGDKHLRELAGRPLAWWVLNAGRKAHLEPLLVAKSGTPLGSLVGEAEVEIERHPDRHPLNGVIAALELTGEPLVVAPCDMPLVPGPLLRALAHADEPTVVEGPAGLEPLLGRYEPEMLPLLHEAVASGDVGAGAGDRVRRRADRGRGAGGVRRPRRLPAQRQHPGRAARDRPRAQRAAALMPITAARR